MPVSYGNITKFILAQGQGTNHFQPRPLITPTPLSDMDGG